jgi:hypothetical protein
VVGLVGPDFAIALYGLPGKDSETIWGQDHPRSRFHVLGLRVPSLEHTAGVLTSAGIGIVRRTDSEIIVDPADTGEVPLVLVEDLMPGDPRG